MSDDDPIRDQLAQRREHNAQLLRRIFGQPEPEPTPDDELPPAA